MRNSLALFQRNLRQVGLLLVIMVGIGLFACPFLVRAQAVQDPSTIEYVSGYEKIDRYDFEAEIVPDGEVIITETIVYDFGSNERRGIFRYIPIDPVDGNVRLLEIDAVQVVDEMGVAQPFVFITDDEFDPYIRIGDADVFVSGVHTYVISYTVENAIGVFDDRHEFYWNAIGNGFAVPIRNVRASVILPASLTDEEIEVYSYCGPEGSSLSCGDIQVHTDVDHTVIDFFHKEEVLFSGYAMTIAVGLPKDIVNVKPFAWWEQPAVTRRLAFLLLGGNIAVFFIIFLGWFFPRWRKFKKSIVVQYEPPKDFTPGQVAAISGRDSGTEVLFSEITYLASLGYLRITEVPKEPSEILTILGVTPKKIKKIEAFFMRIRELMVPIMLSVIGLVALVFVVRNLSFGIVLFFFFAIFIPLQIGALVMYLKDRRNRQKREKSFAFKRLLENTTTLPEYSARLLNKLTANVGEEVTMRQVIQSEKYGSLDSVIRSIINSVSKLKPERLVAIDGKSLMLNIVSKLWWLVFPNWFILGIFVFLLVTAVFSVLLNNTLSVSQWLSASVFIVGIGVFLNIRFILLWNKILRSAKKFDSTTWQHIQGFKLYLETAEKARIDFHDDPLRSTEIFSQWLPYALALGVGEKWAKAFDRIPVTALGWYGSNDTNFSVSSFTYSMSQFSEAVGVGPVNRSSGFGGSRRSSGSSSSRSSGSSGRGSSGGGGGGGGGGSW